MFMRQVTITCLWNFHPIHIARVINHKKNASFNAVLFSALTLI